jgi:hypothetical protein
MAFTPESIRDKIYKILAYYINHIGITTTLTNTLTLYDFHHVFDLLNLLLLRYLQKNKKKANISLFSKIPFASSQTCIQQ